MKIGLDFDGVISDCGRLKSDAAKILHGLDIPPEKCKKEVVIGEGHLTPDQYNNLKQAIYQTRELGLLMEPVSGMHQSITQLLALGHSLIVVTSREGVAVNIAREWTRKQGLTLEFIGVGYGVSKAAACTGLDVYIDDDLEKLEPLVNIVPHRFLFSWGYNSHLDEGTIAMRIDSWKEFLDAVADLSQT